MKNDMCFVVAMVPQDDKSAPSVAASIYAPSATDATARAEMAFADAYPDLIAVKFKTMCSAPMEFFHGSHPSIGVWDWHFMDLREWDQTKQYPAICQKLVAGEVDKLMSGDTISPQERFNSLSIGYQNAILVLTGKAEADDEIIRRVVPFTMESDGSVEFEIYTALDHSKEVRGLSAELRLEAIQYIHTSWSATLLPQKRPRWPAIAGGFHSWFYQKDCRERNEMLAVNIMLIVLGINPAVATVNERELAKKHIADGDATYEAWHETLRTVPGIYKCAPGSLPTYLQPGIANPELATDREARKSYLCGVFPDYAKIQASINSQNKDNENDEEETMTDIAERKGPFYYVNPETGEIGRANKESGLAKAIAAGSIEISKDEHGKRKRGEYIDPADAMDADNDVAADDGETQDAVLVEVSPGVMELVPAQDNHECDDLSAGVAGVDTATSSDADADDAPADADDAADDAADDISATAADDDAEPASEVVPDAPSQDDDSPDWMRDNDDDELPDWIRDDEPAAPAQFKPGVYRNIPNDVYHASNGISSSMIKDARISLMYYHKRHVTREIVKERSDAMIQGALIHTLVLEPEKISAEYSVKPTPGPGMFVKTADYKKFIDEYNASIPEPITADDLRQAIIKQNESMVQPVSAGNDIDSTTRAYLSLPPEFQRIEQGDKPTAQKMKACIKEYNASLPPLFKATGSRDALIDEVTKFDPFMAIDAEFGPKKISASGSKAEMADAIRKVKPDAVFYDELLDEWRRNDSGKELIDDVQMQTAIGVRDAVMAHPSAGALFKHQDREVEVSHYAVDADTGLELKVRPDMVIPHGAYRLGFDLKSISGSGVKESQLKERLRREIIDRDYHVSAAMYCDVAKLDRFYWIFVNKDAGYNWTVIVEAGDELLQLGRCEYRQALSRIAAAHESNEWPAPIAEDYVQGLNEFDKNRLANFTI